ncbi:MAG: hypothetical protein R2713_12925 [Ilumatobacteraceae bacterium]
MSFERSNFRIDVIHELAPLGGRDTLVPAVLLLRAQARGLTPRRRRGSDERPVGFDDLGGSWAPEQEPLGPVAAHRLEATQLIVGLHPSDTTCSPSE